MKRYSILFVAALLLAVAANASTVDKIPVLKPSTTVTVQLQQGWYNGIPVWYICTATNDINFAKTFPYPTLAPKLSSAFFGAGAAEMFIVTNPTMSQGPIFETVPGQNLYSGIWRVALITWQPAYLYQRVPITSIGQALALKNAGKVTWTLAETRLDCPILAVGQLDGPWLCVPRGGYRISQGISSNAYAKTLVLPAYTAFCQNKCTRQINICTFIITDAKSQEIAFQYKANYAPALAGLNSNDTQKIFVFAPPYPPSQLPVLEYCPTGSGIYNQEFNYSPVMRYNVVFRPENLQALVINNATYLKSLLKTGVLTQAEGVTRINASVLYCTPIGVIPTQ